MTTLPLGASVEDLEGFKSNMLDVPLIGLLKAMPLNIPDKDMVADVREWAKQRVALGDIDRMDPVHAAFVGSLAGVERQLADRAELLGKMYAERDALSVSLDVACRAMIGRQQTRATQLFPDKDPRQTDFVKVHTETVQKWKADKMAVHDGNIESFNKITSEIETYMSDDIIKEVKECISSDRVPPLDGVDPDLLRELDALFQDGDVPKAISLDTLHVRLLIYIYIYIKYMHAYILQLRIRKNT